jgi:hypothetical protein
MSFFNYLRLTCLAATALLGVVEAGHAGSVYHVTVDTSPISSQVGFIDMQFNPGIDSLPATVAIRSFSTDGVLASTSDNVGGASCTLPGPPDVIITNTAGFNDLFQQITFGSSISFDAEFTGAALSPSPPLPFFGSVFALALIDSDGLTPLLTTSFDGSLVRIDINPDGSTTATTYSDATDVFRATAILQSVPEPPSLWLLGIGFIGLLVHRSIAQPAAV